MTVLDVGLFFSADAKLRDQFPFITLLNKDTDNLVLCEVSSLLIFNSEIFVDTCDVVVYLACNCSQMFFQVPEERSTIDERPGEHAPSPAVSPPGSPQVRGASLSTFDGCSV